MPRNRTLARQSRRFVKPAANPYAPAPSSGPTKTVGFDVYDIGPQNNTWRFVPGTQNSLEINQTAVGTSYSQHQGNKGYLRKIIIRGAIIWAPNDLNSTANRLNLGMRLMLVYIPGAWQPTGADDDAKAFAVAQMALAGASNGNTQQDAYVNATAYRNLDNVNTVRILKDWTFKPPPFVYRGDNSTARYPNTVIKQNVDLRNVYFQYQRANNSVLESGRVYLIWRINTGPGSPGIEEFYFHNRIKFTDNY